MSAAFESSRAVDFLSDDTLDDDELELGRCFFGGGADMPRRLGKRLGFGLVYEQNLTPRPRAATIKKKNTRVHFASLRAPRHTIFP